MPCSGIIGDFVWNDLNANGVQDAGEPGIAGVQVRLYVAGESNPSQVTVTDANGFYQFTGICSGDFVVEVNPATLPADVWFASPANQGANDASDSDGVDHRAGVSLPADNSTNLTIDFGYFQKRGLTAAKTAVGKLRPPHHMDADQDRQPLQLQRGAGTDPGTSTWTVTATKTEVLNNYSVTGNIVVSNPNPFAASFSVTDQLNDGTVATVSCPTDTVPANGSVTCSYTASPAGATATANVATVTSSVGGATANAAVSFAANVIGDNSVTLGDARFCYSQVISAAPARQPSRRRSRARPTRVSTPTAPTRSR